MLLFGSDSFPVDAYLLSYPENSELPSHVDSVPGYKHYRFNIVLRKPRKGGELICEEAIINTPRIKFFRSDKPHTLSLIERGRRVVLSIGWTVKDN